MITLFLSHASEDKDDFVRPLAVALRSDFKVWFDEYELTLGNPLLKKIDEGLRSCNYGIVVLSQHFFAKRWLFRVTLWEETEITLRAEVVRKFPLKD